jgi:hypothetical protein
MMIKDHQLYPCTQSALYNDLQIITLYTIAKITEMLCFNINLYSFGKFTICYEASNLQYLIFCDIQT